MSEPSHPTTRPDPPTTGSERKALIGWLDYRRATLAWYCDDLSDDELRQRSMPPSELSLLTLGPADDRPMNWT